jgi:hypothetical protein
MLLVAESTVKLDEVKRRVIEALQNCIGVFRLSPLNAQSFLASIPTPLEKVLMR